VVLVFSNAMGMEDADPIVILHQISVKRIALEQDMPDIQTDGEFKLADNRVDQSKG